MQSYNIKGWMPLTAFNQLYEKYGNTQRLGHSNFFLLLDRVNSIGDVKCKVLAQKAGATDVNYQMVNNLGTCRYDSIVRKFIEVKISILR